MDHALRLSRVLGGRVTIACECPIEVLESGSRDRIRAYQDAMAALQRRGLRYGVTCQIELLCGGSMWEDIVTCANLRNHDLVVLGATPDRSGPALVDRTASRVLRTCSSHVLVACRGARPSSGVLVAHDLTSASDGVLRLGFELAKWLGGCLHVVHASADGSQELGRRRAELEFRMARQATRSSLPSAIVTHVHQGSTGDVIWDCAEREGVALVMTGMLGRTGATQLLRRSAPGANRAGLPCPLLTVPEL